MRDTPMDCYTLLADDSSASANDAAQRPAFRAHLIYNLLLNGGIVFSDNQAVCSANLRHLIRWDGTIKEMFRAGAFGLAIRALDPSGEGGEAMREVQDLREVHRAFVALGKTPSDEPAYDDVPELAFIQAHARIRPWYYDDVRASFTSACRTMLHSQFEPLMCPRDFDDFKGLIAGEEERDQGLGRKFLQKDLAAIVARLPIKDGTDVVELIRLCTDAPYVSNLPRTLGLNPIYADEHSRSFELIRGYRYRMEDIEAPRVESSRLDWRHYVAGLNRLDLTDVEVLRDTFAAREYRRLLALGTEDVARFDDLHEAFIEFNRTIEDRIVSHYPEIARQSPGEQRRTFRKQAVARGADVTNGLFDLLAFAFNIGAPGLGFGLGKIVDMVRSKAEGPERPHADAAARDRKLRDLSRYLQTKADARELCFDNRITPSQSFAAEIVVG